MQGRFVFAPSPWSWEAYHCLTNSLEWKQACMTHACQVKVVSFHLPLSEHLLWESCCHGWSSIIQKRLPVSVAITSLPSAQPTVRL